MKKVVLVLVCSLILTVFIAFNYLLWDRERFQDIDASKSASIEALGREINKLTSDNKQLESRISDMDSYIKTLQIRINQLEQENYKNKELISQKNEIINIFKQQVDLKPMEETIIKWVDSIDKGQYETAYDLQLKQYTSQNSPVSLTDFINIFKNNITSMKIKSIKLYIDKVSNDKKGDVVFKVSLEVKKTGDNVRSLFENGINEKLFTVIYDSVKNCWIISDISN